MIFEIIMEYGYKHYWDKDKDASLWFKILHETYMLFVSPITTIKIWILSFKNKRLRKQLGLSGNKK